MKAKQREAKERLFESDKNIEPEIKLDWASLCGPEINSEGDRSFSSDHPPGENIVTPPPRLIPRVLLEVTINLPRRKKNGSPTPFALMTSREQRRHYELLFKKMVHYKMFDSQEDEDMLKNSDYRFEYCQDGNVHLHGYIEYCDTPAHFPVGVICDAVKNFSRHTSKNYNASYLYPNFNRYKSPIIVVQYFNNDNEEKYEEELNRWIKYMTKEIYNK